MRVEIKGGAPLRGRRGEEEISATSTGRPTDARLSVAPTSVHARNGHPPPGGTEPWHHWAGEEKTMFSAHPLLDFTQEDPIARRRRGRSQLDNNTVILHLLHKGERGSGIMAAAIMPRCIMAAANCAGKDFRCHY